ncbi:hypothetical protein R6Y99_06725 [Pseudomonas lundensis]|nr:hypothetical protein [Serratia proteamaculans]MDW5499486.1 hypothetical protein [Serratia proteamaculans]MDW5504547.1 hypothetical protein [Pseudomonas lundensis]
MAKKNGNGVQIALLLLALVILICGILMITTELGQQVLEEIEDIIE